MADITVDPSEVHSIEVDPSQVSAVQEEPHGFLQSAQHAIANWWDQVNPVKNAQGLAETVAHPLDAIKAYGAANSELAHKAQESFKKGDYSEGLRHSLSYLLNGLPGVGTTLDEAGTKTGTGDISGGVGETAGLATNILAPELVKGASAAIPVSAKGAAKAAVQKTAERIYQSALKPSPAAGAEAGAEMSKTALTHAIPVSEAGIEKLSGLIDNLNQKIADKIKAGAAAGAAIDPNAVATRLNDTRSRFANQVNPNADLAAIESTGQEFLQNAGAKPAQAAVPPQPTGVLNAQGQPVMTAGTPATPATPAPPMAVDAAQSMKQGTYSQLRKKYGELSSAQIEAEKALARGIKEELQNVFPEIQGLNAEESKLLQLQPALDRAVARVANHDIIGLGAPVAAAGGAVTAGGPGAAVGFFVKKILDDPQMKSKLAIAIMKGSQTTARPLRFSAAMARVSAIAQSMQGNASPELSPAPAQ